MKNLYESPRRAYINVMELLVAEEVDQQMRDLPPRVLKYLKVIEIETYALNRLPALYASSEKGWQHQYEKAKRELRNQIKSAVRQALAAVQVDPLRSSEPLRLEQDASAVTVLESLRELLKQPDLNWDGVIHRLQDMVSNGHPQLSSPPSDMAGSHRTRYRPNPGDPHYGVPTTGTTPSTVPSHSHDRQYWRPGTYGSTISWERRHHQPDSRPGSDTDDFDWNDPRYNK
ncbi:MAG: late competence development ComFB family protein [Leptolyngbya sp.]|nr:late competence development ComFB family protein [Leptolyngbya sp.]